MSVLDRAIVKAYERRRLSATAEPVASDLRRATDIEATLAEVATLTNTPIAEGEELLASEIAAGISAPVESQTGVEVPVTVDAAEMASLAATEVIEPAAVEPFESPTTAIETPDLTLHTVAVPESETMPDESAVERGSPVESEPSPVLAMEPQEPEVARLETTSQSDTRSITEPPPPPSAVAETSTAFPPAVDVSSSAPRSSSPPLPPAVKSPTTIPRYETIEKSDVSLAASPPASKMVATVGEVKFVTTPESAKSANASNLPIKSPQAQSTTWSWPAICEQLDQFTGDGFRQLARHLQFAAGQGHKVLAFVSSKPGVGRTSVLLTLARILALEGQTDVLVIDADRRHPDLMKQTNLVASVGLSEVLHNQTTLRQAIVSRKPGQVALLPLLKPVSEVEWQGVAAAMRGLVKQVRPDHDMILVDAGVIGAETRLMDCWLRDSADAVITISRQLNGKQAGHEVLNWKQIGIESLGVIETFS